MEVFSDHCGFVYSSILALLIDHSAVAWKKNRTLWLSIQHWLEERQGWWGQQFFSMMFVYYSVGAIQPFFNKLPFSSCLG